MTWWKSRLLDSLKEGFPRLLLILAVPCILACNTPAPTIATAADRIVIIKSQHMMILLHGTQVLKTYNVALGRGGLERKERSGDHRTPEGEYVVDSKKEDSRFYLAIHISYPNGLDIKRARNLGVDAGSAIEIHGLPPVLAWVGSFHRLIDWTDGCIALTNLEMAEVWPVVAVGTPVDIRH